MKLFSHYLKENQDAKKYVFKIKVAGDLPEHCEDVMEAALQKYQVSKFTKGKSTPIQATLLDFPEIKNAAMTVFETELDYPTTSAVLAELLASSTGLSRSCIRVRTPIEEANMAVETEADDAKSILTQDYPKENNQNLVGEKYISNFLKDLAKQRKESQPTQFKGVNEKLLAKSLHKEKATEMTKAGPAHSLLKGLSGNPDPRKGR
jgi:hypothetical protein